MGYAEGEDYEVGCYVKGYGYYEEVEAGTEENATSAVRGEGC